MMKFRGKAGYKFFILLMLLLFPISHSPASAARIAGERGVTPVAPAPPPTSGKTDQQPPGAVRNKPAPTPSDNPTPSQTVRGNTHTDRKKENRSGKTKSGGDRKNEKRFVTIDFDNVDIAIFIKFISELTGKNFVIDKAVRGKVTVISPTKISVNEAYKVFESVLEVNGYATVPAGNIIKIIPAVSARSKNIETRLKKKAISPEDRVVTQLIPLKFADPVELKKLFTPFISKSSFMVPYPPTGTLIVTDVLSNIKRLIRIIDEIDVEGIGEQITVLPLEYATASVLSKSLSSVFQKARLKKIKGSSLQGTIRITSDERTNALIILASEDDTRKIKQLVKLLDREIPRGEGDIHVYYLENANAEDLAGVLKAIPSDQKEARKRGRAPIVSKNVQIVADKATNSLVITASKSDYLVLENVIRKLDISRRMVYIEAFIMEVSLSKSFDLGVEWKLGKDIGSYQGKDLGGFAGSTSKNSKLNSFPAGLAMGVIGEGITVGNTTFPSISAMVNAYKGDSDIHILSTPQIMTTDNEEAEIKVAENIPYLTRQDTSTTGNVDYSNYEYKDVGITLNITPQINQQRYVRLKIMQEVSQVVEEKSTTGLPTTLKRQANTTVVVKDGQTVVIAGLIGETLNKSTSGVPCLADIPGLGYLFKSFSSSRKNTNLFIFITPHIVENPKEAEKIYRQKKSQMKRIREEGVIKMYNTRHDNSGTTLKEKAHPVKEEHDD